MDHVNEHLDYTVSCLNMSCMFQFCFEENAVWVQGTVINQL